MPYIALSPATAPIMHANNAPHGLSEPLAAATAPPMIATSSGIGSPQPVRIRKNVIPDVAVAFRIAEHR